MIDPAVERAQRDVRYWRRCFWVAIGLYLSVLGAMVATDLDVRAAKQSAQQAHAELQFQRQVVATLTTAAEDFRRCKVANAGLVESLGDFDRTIKAQKLLIADAIDLARRCDMQPTQWAAGNVW